MKANILKLISIGAVALIPSLVPEPARAASIVDEWANVKPDPAPELKPVTIDSKTTALVVMDLSKAICNSKQRPRCISTIPEIAKLMSEARSKGIPVISTVNSSNQPADILPDVAPKPDDKVLTGTNSDKFMNTDLEKTLKDKGITTIIAVGSAAQGAVLYTASDAGLRGFKVIVPVDGLSSESLYAEQAVVWLLAHAPRVAQQTTLTRVDMIKF